MIEILKNSDFKIMPWKNGGGVTTEIFRFPLMPADSFLFRLSKAKISSDGPFSLFPNIDRILFLLEGHGFKLSSSKRQLELIKPLIPLEFQGEEDFTCELISGPCTDFNVMTDRNFANSTIFVIYPADNAPMNFTAQCDLKCIYDIGKETLYKLEESDQYIIEVMKGSPLIVIDTKFL